MFSNRPASAGAPSGSVRIGRTVAWGCGALLVLGIGWAAADRLLPLRVSPPPAQTLPSPNGFARTLEATKRLQREEAVKAAFASAPKRRLSTREKEELVGANAGALAALRSGFDLPYQESRPKPSLSTVFPHYAKMRTLGRLLLLEGQVHQEHGRYTDALNSHLDAVYTGRRTPRGTALVGGLVGYSLESMGRRPVFSFVARLDPAAARAGVRRLEAMESLRVPLSETLTEEKYVMQGVLLEMFEEPDKVLREISSQEPAAGDADPKGRAGGCA